MRTSARLALVCLFACAPLAIAQSCPVKPATPATDADKAFAAGEFAKAETLYAAQPTTAGTIGLVHTQLEQNRLNDAVTTAQAAAAKSPNDADLQALAGEALLRDGQISAATTPLSKALNLDHCSARALYGLAIYNQLISKPASAAGQLSSAHRLTPGDAQIAAAWAMSLQPTERAQALQALLASSPTLPPSQVTRLTAMQQIAAANATCTVHWPEKPLKVDLWPLTTVGTKPRSWGIKMHVGATDIAVVELDSSVSGIVLNPHDAKNAGVHPIGAAAPNAPYSYAVADVVRVNGAEFHNCPVRVATSETVGGANSLIGTDFFRDRLIHIDYVDRSMTLTPPANPATGLVDRVVPPAEKDWSVAYFANENILLPTLINKKGPYLMLLDTGSMVSVYAPVIGDSKPVAYKDSELPLRGVSVDIVKIVPQINGGDPNTTRLHGPGGKYLPISIPVRQPDLRFFNNNALDIDPVSFDITPKSQEAGVEISGLLGFSVLQNFTLDIDYQNGLVRMFYDILQRYNAREVRRTNMN